jgi:hypothetical protein
MVWVRRPSPKPKTEQITRDITRFYDMTMKTAETTLWQRNLASLIRTGLFDRAEVIGLRGLHAIVGVYGDGSHSAPLAKYGDSRRAGDALNVVQRLAEPRVPVEAN